LTNRVDRPRSNTGNGNDIDIDIDIDARVQCVRPDLG